MELDLARLAIVGGSLVAGAVGKKLLKNKPRGRKWVGVGVMAAAATGGIGAEAAGWVDRAVTGEGGVQGALAVGLHSLFKNARQGSRRK